MSPLEPIQALLSLHGARHWQWWLRAVLRLTALGGLGLALYSGWFIPAVAIALLTGGALGEDGNGPW